ncbi:hypothetical protein G3N95_23340 [Paraburkholderia sp. Tr-20389]|nr:hypothetical protein [Paraburkholderia sp. Tr-20389]
MFGGKATTNEVAQSVSAEAEEIRLDEQTVQRLLSNLEAMRLVLDRSKAEAVRCLADPAAVLPQELQRALVSERDAQAAYDAAVSEHRCAADALFERQKEITERRAREDSAARKTAFEAARSAYWAQCEALIKPALEVRCLAAAAGVWMPTWQPGDLLFADDSDISVAGQVLSIWRSMTP